MVRLEFYGESSNLKTHDRRLSVAERVKVVSFDLLR